MLVKKDIVIMWSRREHYDAVFMMCMCRVDWIQRARILMAVFIAAIYS